MEETYWKKCNICKKPIPFQSRYWICSVSTCNQSRTGLTFCAVQCWDAHLPFANHKQSGAIEKRAPSLQEHSLAAANTTPEGAQPKIVAAAPVIRRSADGTQIKVGTVAANPGFQSGTHSGSMTQVSAARQSGTFSQSVSNKHFPKDILIVASKLKSYIAQASEMNTSADVMEILSDRVRMLTDQAIERAKQDGRKTVMARDF